MGSKVRKTSHTPINSQPKLQSVDSERTSLHFFSIVGRELVTPDRVVREPEPDLVMDGPEQVRAYAKASGGTGSMAPVHLLHSRGICDVVFPGAVVLDVACGTGDLLRQVAGLNPQARFVGVDLSEPMLAYSREQCAEQKMANIELRKEDCRDLSSFADSSVDIVMSTMALHHLPTSEDLRQVFRQIERVLRPNGCVYIADFGLLHSHQSMQRLSLQYADREDTAFIDDYYRSLKAAFTVEEFRAAVALVKKTNLVCICSALLPFMVVIKGGQKTALPPKTKSALSLRRRQLPFFFWRDYLVLRLLLFFGQ